MRLNAIVAALTILLFSPAVLALSLGEAKSQSHLNQPLKASIVVRAVKYDERDTIRAIIPDAEKFNRAGVRRDPIVDNMRVDIADGDAEDELRIHISTEKRIKEPFVNFLVEVKWLGGSVTREYTLLLDPAPVAAARQGSDDVSTQPMADAGSQNENTFTDESLNERPSTGVSGSRQYGPVKRHETLWSIAFSQRRDPSISMDQMQLAIYQANPQAFDGNINQMRTGSMLTIPSDNDIRAIDPSYAKREVRNQKQNYQPPAPAYVAPPEQPAPAYVPEPVPEPEPVVAPEPEPEPVVEAEPEPVVEAEPEVVSEPEVAVDAPEQAADTAPETVAEPPPAMASASATADGDALTEDELVAEGDEAEASSGDIEMPSVWVDEETVQKDDAPQDAPANQADAEEEVVVDTPPPESGFDLGPLTDVVSPVTLLLAVVLIIVILITYWWYRKRSVKNVGTQFAHATDEEAEPESTDSPAEKKSDEPVGSETSPGSVWSDEGGLPDSIDEYAASTPGADELDLGDVPAESSSEPVSEDATEIELDSDDSSPIRDLSGEEIDYLGEADVHLAYGLYDEAASVLQRGIDENPGRTDLRLKLLEVYHSGGMPDEYVASAEAWQASGDIDENDWSKVVEMGQEVAPASALFGSGDAASESVEEVKEDDSLLAASTVEAGPDETSISLDAEAEQSTEEPAEKEVEAADESLDFDLSGFDLESSPSSEPKAEPEPEEEASAEASTEDDGLEFDTAALGLGDDEAETESPDLDIPVAADESDVEALAETSLEEGDDALDIDLGELSLSDDAAADKPSSDPDFDAPEPEGSIDALSPGDSLSVPDEETALEPSDSAQDDDLSSLGLDTESKDLDDTPIADDPSIDAPASGGDEEEVSVKLDLARAYMDMGEPEMARALLDEVVEMGNDQQKQEAQDLISRA